MGNFLTEKQYFAILRNRSFVSIALTNGKAYDLVLKRRRSSNFSEACVLPSVFSFSPNNSYEELLSIITFLHIHLTQGKRYSLFTIVFRFHIPRACSIAKLHAAMCNDYNGVSSNSNTASTSTVKLLQFVQIV